MITNEGNRHLQWRSMLRHCKCPTKDWVRFAESGLDFCFCFPNALFKCAHGKVGLLFVDEKWRREPDGIFTGAQDAQSLVEREIDDGIPQVRCFFLRALIPD